MIERIERASAEELSALRELVSAGAAGFDVPTELARRYARLFVSRAATRIEGFLLAWDVADEVHLLDVIVAPSARRRGHGRELVTALLEHARARRARLVLLEVRKSNHAARSLYEKLGFVTAGERPAYYSDGEDAVLMQHEATP